MDDDELVDVSEGVLVLVEVFVVLVVEVDVEVDDAVEVDIDVLLELVVVEAVVVVVELVVVVVVDVDVVDVVEVEVLDNVEEVDVVAVEPVLELELVVAVEVVLAVLAVVEVVVGVAVVVVVAVVSWHSAPPAHVVQKSQQHGMLSGLAGLSAARSHHLPQLAATDTLGLLPPTSRWQEHVFPLYSTRRGAPLTLRTTAAQLSTCQLAIASRTSAPLVSSGILNPGGALLPVKSKAVCLSNAYMSLHAPAQFLPHVASASARSHTLSASCCDSGLVRKDTKNPSGSPEPTAPFHLLVFVWQPPRHFAAVQASKRGSPGQTALLSGSSARAPPAGVATGVVAAVVVARAAPMRPHSWAYALAGCGLVAHSFAPHAALKSQQHGYAFV